MPSLKVPSNVSRLIVAGATLVPSGGRVDITDPVAFDIMSGAGGRQTQPALVSQTGSQGDLIISTPPVLTSITIDGTTFNTAGGNMTLSAASGTQFLNEQKYIK